MKRTTIIGLIALVAATVALAAPGIASAAGWKYWQLDTDRCWDATTIDANGNGNYEVSWYDIDNDCRWDMKIWNSVGGDDFAESMTYDMNEDGRWEIWLADNDQQVGFDVVYFDDNARRLLRPLGADAARALPLDDAGRGARAGLVRRHDPPERRDGPRHPTSPATRGTAPGRPPIATTTAAPTISTPTTTGAAAEPDSPARWIETRARSGGPSSFVELGAVQSYTG